MRSITRIRYTSEDHSVNNLVIVPCIRAYKTYFEVNTFKFIGHSKIFSGEVYWADNSLELLWQFNLHYFDYINDGSIDPRSSVRLILSWLDFRKKTDIFYSPYPLSLRVVNWIKFVCQFHESMSQSDMKRIEESLFRQGMILNRSFEKHLLGNHYLKNVKALLFLGCFLNGKSSSRWLKKSISMLSQEVDEQFLDDGGHFELSPMYHCIAMEDLLDILNILRSSNADGTNVLEDTLQNKIEAGLEWICAISFGKEMLIPFFNDCAYNIAPEVPELLNYAERLGIGINDTETTILPDSGFYILKNKIIKIVVDCGKIGPDYAPGHGHCDMLSFEMWANGLPVFINSGTYTYIQGCDRTHFRATRSHNTVAFSSHEQSEIWGNFRVGKRARPIEASLDNNQFRGEMISPAGYRHRREIALLGSNISIDDVIYSKSNVSAKSAIFVVHPDFADRILAERDKCVLVYESCEVSLTCENIKIEDCEVSFVFGEKIKSKRIIVTSESSHIHTKISVSIA